MGKIKQYSGFILFIVFIITLIGTIIGIATTPKPDTAFKEKATISSPKKAKPSMSPTEKQ